MIIHSRRGFVQAAVTSVLVVVMALGFTAPSAFAKGGGGGDAVKFKIRLQATDLDPLASGKVKFEQRSSRTKLNIEVEDVSSAAAVEFVVDGQSLGTATLVLGTAELELNSRDGANPPVITPSAVVRILDVDSGAVILQAN